MSAASSPRGPGRRRGRHDTKGEILAAARRAFGEHGFAGTSVRRVAALAGVDPALIHHYFGTKRQLFLATVDLPVDVPVLIQGVADEGLPGMGERLIRAVVSVWESPLQPGLVAALRTTLGDPDLADQLREFLSLEVVQHILGDLDLPPENAERRAGLVASQVLGILVGRYLLRLPALTRQSTEQLCRSAGATVQHYLEGDIDGSAAPA